MQRYETETRPGLVALYDISQETEWVNSYNPGARTGWSPGRHSACKKLGVGLLAGCWFVDGDNLTGILHILQLQLLSPPTYIILSSNKIQNGDVLVPANRDHLENGR